MVRQRAHSALTPTSEIPTRPSTEEDEKFVSRVIREWDPGYISLACPLVAATLVGPSAANVRAACDQATGRGQDGTSRYLEMFKLILARIGEYWEIGPSVLSTYISYLALDLSLHLGDSTLTFRTIELVQLLETRQSFDEIGNAEMEALGRLPVLLPNLKKEPPS